VQCYGNLEGVKSRRPVVVKLDLSGHRGRKDEEGSEQVA
jgi:hypothetical protein